MRKGFLLFLSVCLLASCIFFLTKRNKATSHNENEEFESEEFVKERSQYELDILKDPATGEIPKNIYQKELDLAMSLPVKGGNGSVFRTENLNTYSPVGPNNIGGRTRALVIDKRFGTSGNQVILSGSVSGGIYKSADGGATWNRVTPENEIHAVTAIAQDTRTGFENTWYAGGGEALGNSASDQGNAFYYGYGILKSTDNGNTWTKLTLAVTNTDGTLLANGTLEAFDNVFDVVHKIIVNPANGNVYIAGHRRLVRSTDGGNSFQVVFAGPTAANSATGQMDIISNSAGKLFLAVNGGNPDAGIRGVWTSTTGNFNSWTRIAGGSTLGVDSLSGWRGNSYTANAKRILLALAPSNQNLLYILYENGLSQLAKNGAKPEADLYKYDLSNNSYANLSANMPDFPGQADNVDPIAVQGGYDMVLAVKPDNPNVVFVAGTNLYRSTDGFSTTTNTDWIAGYRKKSTPNAEPYPISHPDIHNLVFDPTNANRAFCLNDGGIQITDNIMAAATPDPVTWANINNYQTLQYYYVAIDPAAGQNNFFGGAQDNGCYLRVAGGTNPNSHFKISGGDGASVSIASVNNSAFTLYYSSQQGSIGRDVTNTFTDIKPNNLTVNPDGGFGDFVTYFKNDFDNPEDLYYVNFNRIFRTGNASTVTSATWSELTGAASKVNPTNATAGTNITIRAIELSRGPYLATHNMYIGTSNGKVYRLTDPRNAAANATPDDITPAGLTGNVSDIAVNPNNDNEVMVTVSNYGVISIWYTSNAKSTIPTWKNVEGTLTLPSARSCMIVVKKDASNNPVIEYYVGTSVGLYSTTDINASTVNWVREGGNVLNYAVVTSLDYRPSDNTLLVGTHGNGMFSASTGTPNYTPNNVAPIVTTGTFIVKAFPTLTNSTINYQVGNLTTVNKISVRVINMSGQLLYKNESGYQNGVIDVSKLSKGMYILNIISSDNKYKYLQKFVRY